MVRSRMDRENPIKTLRPPFAWVPQPFTTEGGEEHATTPCSTNGLSPAQIINNTLVTEAWSISKSTLVRINTHKGSPTPAFPIQVLLVQSQ